MRHKPTFLLKSLGTLIIMSCANLSLSATWTDATFPGTNCKIENTEELDTEGLKASYNGGAIFNGKEIPITVVCPISIDNSESSQGRVYVGISGNPQSGRTRCTLYEADKFGTIIEEGISVEDDAWTDEEELYLGNIATFSAQHGFIRCTLPQARSGKKARIHSYGVYNYTRDPH